jgi:hypothetical protein
MRVEDRTSVDPDSVRARVLVSISYVQRLRREAESGRLSMAVVEEYLARLERHLVAVERCATYATDDPLGSGMRATVAGIEDRLIAERVSPALA